MQGFAKIPEILTNPILTFITIAGFYIFGFILAWIFRILFSKLAKKTPWRWDDVVIEVIKKWIPIWMFFAGVYIALGFWSFSPQVGNLLNKASIIILGITVIIAFSSLSTKLIMLYASKIEQAFPMTSLTKNMARFIVIIVGTLMLLNGLGISITPLLTTLGIGGLAVALALQDTLSNLFAGFYITLARQLRIGDFIKLESGEEGYVLDIGWRATRIRMLPNNVVLIPNSKLAQSIITNYYFPEKELAVLVQVGVHYDSDLEHVERVTIEVAKEVMEKIKGGVPGFKPFIRYHTFDDFSINFTVILRAKEFVDNYLIKHEFIKRLHKRYKKEGIVIPYPIRAINYSQEKSNKISSPDSSQE